MGTGQDLVSEISDYLALAQQLEATRRTLTPKILEVVKTQIIPELSPLLPSGYSFDVDGSNVYGVGDDTLPNSNIHEIAYDTIPTEFSVHLRLLYEGKPISLHDEVRERGIGRIQRDLKPKLEELSQRYRLESIMPYGEPISM